MQAEDVIKIVPDFLTPFHRNFWMELNDELLITQKDHVAILEDGTRPLIEFGIDRSPEHESLSHHDFKIVQRHEDAIRNLMRRVELVTANLFNETSQVHVCSFWFAKQLPGAFVSEHDDTDGGFNTHFKYSAIVYLNDMIKPATLSFTDWDYHYQPKAGDLVVFDTNLGGKHKVDQINEYRYTIPMWMTLDPTYAL